MGADSMIQQLAAAKALTLAVVRNPVSTVVITRASLCTRLGLGLKVQAGNLFIAQIKRGSVEDYNRNSPIGSPELLIGQQIVAINEVRTEPEALIIEMRDAKDLTFVVRNAAPC